LPIASSFIDAVGAAVYVFAAGLLYDVSLKFKGVNAFPSANAGNVKVIMHPVIKTIFFISYSP